MKILRAKGESHTPHRELYPSEMLEFVPPQ